MSENNTGHGAGVPPLIPEGADPVSDRPGWAWRAFDAAFFAAAIAFVGAIGVLYVGLALIVVRGALSGFDRMDDPTGLAFLYSPLTVAYVVGLVSYVVYAGSGRLVGRPAPRPVWLRQWTRRSFGVYPILLLPLAGIVCLIIITYHR